jgi:hypothetical protein
MLQQLLPTTLGPDSRLRFCHSGSRDAMTSLEFSLILTKICSDHTTLKRGLLFTEYIQAELPGPSLSVSLCLSLSLCVSLCLSLSLSASSRTYLSPLSFPSISRSLSISIYLRIRNSMLLRGWLIYCWTSYFIQIKDRQADRNCPGHLYLSIDQSIYLIFCKKYGMFF